MIFIFLFNNIYQIFKIILYNFFAQQVKNLIYIDLFINQISSQKCLNDLIQIATLPINTDCPEKSYPKIFDQRMGIEPVTPKKHSPRTKIVYPNAQKKFKKLQHIIKKFNFYSLLNGPKKHYPLLDLAILTLMC